MSSKTWSGNSYVHKGSFSQLSTKNVFTQTVTLELLHKVIHASGQRIAGVHVHYSATVNAAIIN